MNKETEKQKFRGSHVAILGNKFKLNGMKNSGTISEVKYESDYTKFLILEQNRDIIKEGKSVLITVLKDLTNRDNRFRRISVKKLVSLSDISNHSIPKIIFEIENMENLKVFSHLISEKGNTNVKIVVLNKPKNLTFELTEKRKINPKILKSLKKEGYLKRINL